MENIKDIPDAEAKAKPVVEMAPDVQAEREVRRYINKEGIFARDLEQLFAVATGIDSSGRMQYRQTQTKESAEKMVTELLEKSGRKVGRDSISGRLKAAPGWNLNIRVPGMQKSEEKAASESDAHLQARVNQQQLLDLRSQNEALQKRLDALEAKDLGAAKMPEDETPEPEQTEPEQAQNAQAPEGKQKNEKPGKKK